MILSRCFDETLLSPTALYQKHFLHKYFKVCKLGGVGGGVDRAESALRVGPSVKKNSGALFNYPFHSSACITIFYVPKRKANRNRLACLELWVSLAGSGLDGIKFIF